MKKIALLKKSTALSKKGIVLLTAKRSKEEAEKIAKKYGCETATANAEIASLIKLGDIGNKELEKISGAKLLLLPGYCPPSLAEAIERKTGTPAFLGAKNMANLPAVLSMLGKIKLSKRIPACELIKEEIKRRARKELELAEKKEKANALLKQGKALLVGKAAVSKELPMRIIAEIANAEQLDKNSLLKKARYFENEGASIIALGFCGENPGRVKKHVKYLKSKSALPVAVDTGSEEEMRAALKSGADLLMSFDRKMISKFSNVRTPCVIIPEQKAKSAEEKLKSIKENISLARKRKFTNLIADLILEPLNFGAVESIIAYKMFDEKQECKDFVPLLFGAGNITELIDADSVGVNAVLAALASECGASLLFTVEASGKCKGSVKELATASKMMYLAKKRNSYAKDLGIDLLFLKEKTKKKEAVDFDLGQAKIIEAESKNSNSADRLKFRLDSAGDFVVFLKEEANGGGNRKIFAAHFQRGETGLKPDVVVKGESAEEICNAIMKLGLVKDVKHAMYIARELEKAEIALRTGRSYVQEERVF